MAQTFSASMSTAWPATTSFRGLDGNDQLSGGTGNDWMIGGTGNDGLIGGAGKDTMFGGTGNDVLIGGVGQEARCPARPASTRSGSTGFPKSTVGVTHDVIKDFQTGVDHIDLHNIDANSLTAANEAFTFISAQGFHHHAGELHVLTKTGFFLVEADTNGDGLADFQIRVAGSLPTLHDFICNRGSRS